MAGRVDGCLRLIAPCEAAVGAVGDIEDEVPLAIGAIAHEGATGHGVWVDIHGGDIDAIATQALEVEVAEIVIAYAGHDGAGLPEVRHLINEDRRGTRRIRAEQLYRLAKPAAGCHGHDLDE